ncbi:hypothetical protein PIIN_05881 [Serendipita indica DSM 11827]|uniref:Uncharacterized protein n=1 Tax=Serendipita indica (strain DSM 11827) TaxID=1109443 RepID=G4TKV3_SERID|nr:hypothetical protein PIIN_05881 [Serendipita indica DSM 11827]
MEERNDVVAHYPTELPEEFYVGMTSIRPLVTVSELQAHLRLLGAFHKLKADVESQDEGLAAKDKDLAWVVFVNKAVVSFFNWMTSKRGPTRLPLDDTAMPPLPVIMVWHTYLLNPRHYYEDSQRISNNYSKHLTILEEFPLELAASLIDEESLGAYPPSEKRRKTFEDRATSTYDILLVTYVEDGLSLPCPFCEHLNPHVTWVANGERGFAQPRFEHKCEGCHQTFNKGNIGVGRFVDEFIMKKKGESIYFPETYLRARDGIKDIYSAEARYSKIFKQLDEEWALISSSTGDRKEQKKLLASTLRWDPDVLCDVMHTSSQPRIPLDRDARVKLLHRLATAYSHAGYASLDLVAAVLRQATFIDKIVHMGWTRPGRWEHADSLAPLVRSVARYHAFLDLMYTNSWSLLVPTLDIDLSWHTHQLKGRTYRERTLSILGRTPNHDDSIDAGVISSRYDQTAKLWRERFGVPYSVCGCAPDPVSSVRVTASHSPVTPHPTPPLEPPVVLIKVTQDTMPPVDAMTSSFSSIPPPTAHPKRRVTFISKLAAFLMRKPKPVQEQLQELVTKSAPEPTVEIRTVPSQPPWKNPRPDLISMEDEDSEASHPSEHNVLFGKPESAGPNARRSSRQKKVGGFVRRAQTQGHDDPFCILQVERNKNNKEKEGHLEAFTDIKEGSAKYYAFWGVSMAIPLG